MAWHSMAWDGILSATAALLTVFFSFFFVQCTWFEIIKLQTFYNIVRLNRQTKRQSVRIALVYLLVYMNKFTSCYNWILYTFFFDFLFIRVLLLLFFLRVRSFRARAGSRQHHRSIPFKDLLSGTDDRSSTYIVIYFVFITYSQSIVILRRLRYMISRSVRHALIFATIK